MAKSNPCDILTGDWNPVIGCHRYSSGCRDCWFLDFIFPWQQRLGNIPALVQPDAPHVFESRMSVEALKTKSGIVGVCQHGDLFWDLVPDATIHRVLDIVEKAVSSKRVVPKYVLWTKRAERMASILSDRYPQELPPFLACAVSMESQPEVDQRMPYLLQVRGTRIAVIEPMLGPVDLAPHVQGLNWVIVGSETGKNRPRTLDPNWVRVVRDQASGAGVPFFLKQLNDQHGPQALRALDGRTWDEFPPGFSK